MDTLTIIGIVMIIFFMVMLLKKKMSPYVALMLVPILFGLITLLIQGNSLTQIFDWIYEGIFYKVDGDGGVSGGVISTAMLLYFAVAYFSVMLDVGLFDPLAVKIIDWCKGDPVKVSVGAMVMTLIVSLDGDGTTTALIILSSILPLWKAMGMKGLYLAVIVGFGNSTMNLVPWSGPMSRTMAITGIGADRMFPPVIPGMLAASVLAIFMAYTYGIKERQRLNYQPGESAITQEHIDEIKENILAENSEYKRPKLIWFNFALTVVVMVGLILGWANGAILFMIGTAIALFVNYRDNYGQQTSRITDNGDEIVGASLMIIGSGALTGILEGSGMSDAIANFIINIVPTSLAAWFPLLIVFLSSIITFMLGNDAFYFGILPILMPVATSAGASELQVCVAALIGQTTRFGSPLVAFIYILFSQIGVDYKDYAKEYLKWSIPSMILQTLVAVLLGHIPVPIFG